MECGEFQEKKTNQKMIKYGDYQPPTQNIYAVYTWINCSTFEDAFHYHKMCFSPLFPEKVGRNVRFDKKPCET